MGALGLGREKGAGAESVPGSAGCQSEWPKPGWAQKDWKRFWHGSWCVLGEGRGRAGTAALAKQGAGWVGPLGRTRLASAVLRAASPFCCPRPDPVWRGGAGRLHGVPRQGRVSAPLRARAASSCVPGPCDEPSTQGLKMERTTWLEEADVMARAARRHRWRRSPLLVSFPLLPYCIFLISTLFLEEN